MSHSQGNREGLRYLRFILALSSFSPLFVLWAARGVTFLSDICFVSACLGLAIVPSCVLFARETIAKKQRDSRNLKVGRVENQSGHILVYLFAVLLPFYSQDVDGWRDLFAFSLALMIIVFLFWHLNFYYINLNSELNGGWQ